MPYITCVVSSCKTQRNPNTNKSDAVKCFSFPKDPAIKKEWLQLCQVHESESTSDSSRKVCIKHFKEDDFEDGLKARLMNLQPRILKKNAVPSLYLNSDVDSETSDEILLRKKRKLLEKLLEEAQKPAKSRRSKSINRTESKEYKEYLSKLVPIAPKRAISAPEEHKTPKRTPITLKRPIQSKDLNPKSLKYPKVMVQEDSSNKTPKVKDAFSEHCLNILHHDNVVYQQRINELEFNQEQLKLKIKELETKIQEFDKTFVNKIKQLFADYLTPNQIDVMLGELWTNWTDIELAKAYMLYMYSEKAYAYVRDTLSYPLPAFSAVVQWATKMGAELPRNDNVGAPNSKYADLSLEKIKNKSVDNIEISVIKRNNTQGLDIQAENVQAEFDIKVEADNNEISNEIGIDEYDIRIGFKIADENALEIVCGKQNNVDYHNHAVDSPATNDINIVKKFNNHLDSYDNNDSCNDKNDETEILSEEVNGIDEDTYELYEELIVDNFSEQDIDNLNEDNYSIIEEDNG